MHTYADDDDDAQVFREAGDGRTGVRAYIGGGSRRDCGLRVAKLNQARYTIFRRGICFACEPRRRVFLIG